MQFNVHPARLDTVVDGKYVRIPGFKVVGYQTAGVNFPVESDVTTDRAVADDWCARINAGEKVPEAKFASYCDD